MFKNSRTSLVEHPQINEACWWKRRTKLEKRMCILIVFLLIKSAIFAITFCTLYFMYRNNSGIFVRNADSLRNMPQDERNVCFTLGCIVAAATILENMDPKALPCEDFYQYACGGFIENNYIPDSETKIEQFSIIAEDLTQQIKDIIQSSVIKEEDSELLIKMKNYYTSCMHGTKDEENELKLLEDLIEKVGGWPVIKGAAWDGSNFQWQDLMFRFKDLNLSPDSFISFGVVENMFENRNHVIAISPPQFPLPKEFYSQGLSQPYVKAYYEYLVKSAVLFGAEEEQAKKDMNDVLQLEIELTQLLQTTTQVTNVTTLFLQMNLSQLQETIPEIDWKKYMERILPFKFEDSEIFYLVHENYTLNFIKILNASNPKTLANFAVGKMVRSLARTVSEDFSEIHFSVFKTLSGVQAKPAKWRECLDETKTIFPVGIAHEYIKKWFTPEQKKEAQEMVNFIKEEMHEMLKNAEWLDEETLNNALDKLSAMESIVAYPDENLDYFKVAQLYENLTMNADTYFQNVRNHDIFIRDKEYSKLRKFVKKLEWEKYADVAIVDAFFNNMENVYLLPVGILQNVFFDYERPAYMNFASIGTIIGHEITHGFDDKGRQFNKNGRLQNWWKPETSKKFEELTQCMIDQYDNYWSPEVDMMLNGKNCLGENIADNGGLKNSYHAYQRWVQKYGSEPTLPGLNFTTNQLFWLSYANIWCNKARSQYLIDQMQFGEHTISQFRVIGPLSNMPDFAKDFNCPVNSTMNPAKRCAVW